MSLVSNCGGKDIDEARITFKVKNGRRRNISNRETLVVDTNNSNTSLEHLLNEDKLVKVFLF